MAGFTKAEKDQMRGHLKHVRDIYQRVMDTGQELTAEEQKAAEEHLAKANAIKEAATKRAALGVALGAFDGFDLGDADRKDQGKYGSHARADGLLVPGRKSVGELVTDSEQYKRMLASSNGHFGEKTRVSMDPVGFATLRPKRGSKALITSGDSDGDSANVFVMPQHLGLDEDSATSYRRDLAVRALFTQARTTTDTIDYVKLKTTTNNAAPVAEATHADAPEAPEGDEGGPLVYAAGAGVKPQSAMTWEKDDTTVKTIAHWMPITRRALADAAQVMSMIDAFLSYGLEEEVEDQLLTGNGTGENLKGLNAYATATETQSQAWDTNLFKTLLKGKTKVRRIGKARPTAYLLNPADVERIQLEQDLNGAYRAGGPFREDAFTLWGLRVVESEAVAEGVGWVAAWDRGVIWDREQTSVQVSTEHADFFIRNLVAVLAECRLAFALLNPRAFCQLDLTA